MVNATTAAPSPARRALVAVIVAICVGIVAWLKQLQLPASQIAGDYTFHWRAARALLDGHSPYAVIKAVGGYPWNDSYRYPLPAALMVLPLAWLRVKTSAAVFLGVSSGLLAFGITREGFQRLLAFASVSFIFCFSGSQLTPLLMGSALLPAIGGLLITKPNIGLALFAAWPSRYAVLGGVALTLVSIALQPHWPMEWLAAVRAHTTAEGNYATPISMMGGPVLLLALLRWRRPEARLLLGLALVPQSFFFYDQLPLALIPRSRREYTLFAALTLAALLIARRLLPAREASIAATTHTVATVFLYVLFVPCLVLVLLRENRGAVPEWLERAVRRWPTWIRGEPVDTRLAEGA
jgi:hypothetical protein